MGLEVTPAGPVHGPSAPLAAEIARRIRQAAPEVGQILLFGSRARGEARPDSDYDLLAVVPNGADKRAIAVRARLSLWGLGVGIDLLTLTAAELQAVAESDSWYHRQMLQEARPLDGAIR